MKTVVAVQEAEVRNERRHRLLVTLGAKSICQCGHTGDGPQSDHAGSLGHHGCMIQGCGCQRFAWGRWTGAAETLIASVS